MNAVWLGEIGYRRALDMQLDHLSRRADGEIGDTLLLLTHPNVYTIGRTGDPANLLVSEDELSRDGVALERIARGGDITWHGPGQLVGYPIIGMPRPDLHRYLRALEAAIIEAMASFGIASEREDGLTGVWSGGKKIASIGVGVKRWVTYHGFALNVSNDLSWFRKINLCGLKGREATSMSERLGGNPPSMERVLETVSESAIRHLAGFAE